MHYLRMLGIKEQRQVRASLKNSNLSMSIILYMKQGYMNSEANTGMQPMNMR